LRPQAAEEDEEEEEGGGGSGSGDRERARHENFSELPKRRCYEKRGRSMKLLINLGVWAVRARSNAISLCVKLNTALLPAPWMTASRERGTSSPAIFDLCERRDYRVCYIPRVCVSRRKRITEAEYSTALYGKRPKIADFPRDVKAVTKQCCNDSCRILVRNANNNLTVTPAL